MAFGEQFSKIVISLGVVALLLAGTFGFPHFGMSMSMDMEGSMTMTDCYMPGMVTLCNMNPLEHIASWQGVFESLPLQNFVAMLLLLVVTALIGFVWVRQAHSPPQDTRGLSLQFLRRWKYATPATPLQELFSSGILNPKLF